MRIALYARVSTDKCEVCGKKPRLHPGVGHEFKGQNPEVQLAELRAWCVASEYAIAAEYVDYGISGSETSRPEYDRLMADAEARKFDAVLVWRLNRFGRSTIDLQLKVKRLLDAGVSFISKQEGFDLTSPMGRMTFGILCVLAQFEREMISENTRSGMKDARAKGHKPGPKIDPVKGPSRWTRRRNDLRGHRA